jgi:hypothetical protein
VLDDDSSPDRFAGFIARHPAGTGFPCPTMRRRSVRRDRKPLPLVVKAAKMVV